jgi:hypothetical protein
MRALQFCDKMKKAWRERAEREAQAKQVQATVQSDPREVNLPFGQVTIQSRGGRDWRVHVPATNRAGQKKYLVITATASSSVLLTATVLREPLFHCIFLAPAKAFFKKKNASRAGLPVTRRWLVWARLLAVLRLSLWLSK